MDRFFRGVDAPEVDTFSAVVVQDFDGVAVEDGDDGDGDDGAGEVRREHD
jgi:hypothetical protein